MAITSVAHEPGALIRGGWFGSRKGAGVFAVFGVEPSATSIVTGFRCAR